VNISSTFDDATRKKYEGLLEKKWTSVVRLQKKVTSFEAACAIKWLMPAGAGA
jgi:platelet-activating factor acetylhydrolase IB subunit alpha